VVFCDQNFWFIRGFSTGIPRGEENIFMEIRGLCGFLSDILQ
jgi:hypothetical protein